MGRAMNVPQDFNFLRGGVAITWNLEPQNVLENVLGSTPNSVRGFINLIIRIPVIKRWDELSPS